MEKELIADRFDLGDGFIDYWAFASGLRPEREVKFKHKPRNEAEQVDQEVRQKKNSAVYNLIQLSRGILHHIFFHKLTTGQTGLV